MYEDKSIRISVRTYKILTDLKKRTGKPIKRIISDWAVSEIFNNKRKPK